MSIGVISLAIPAFSIEDIEPRITTGASRAGTRGEPMSGQKRLGLALSNEVPVSQTVALAVRAEQLGFSEVWLPESGHGRGLFTVAASVAAATRRVGIGIGIVNPFWRHPSLIAMEAAALDEASGGRVRARPRRGAVDVEGRRRNRRAHRTAADGHGRSHTDRAQSAAR